MTKTALFQALKKHDEETIRKILTPEISNIKCGLPRTIDPSACDEDGNSLAHYAAKWSTNDIPYTLIVELRANLTIKDKDGKLPEYYDWSGRFQKYVTQRQTLEQEEKAIATHEAFVAEFSANEAKSNSYKTGIIFTHNFSIHFSAKNPNKICEVPDAKSPDTQLTIHQAQAIAETVVAHRKTPGDQFTTNNLSGRVKDLPGTNYIIANIGCIITDKPHTKGGDHKRIFLTAPIHLKEEKSPNYPNRLHSEVIFIDHFLKNEKNIQTLIHQLMQEHKILTPKEAPPRKIYSLIFDLHSSQDVCDDCGETILNFQKTQTQNIKNILRQMGFHVPKDDNNNFKILFRISSSRRPSHTKYRTPLHKREKEKPFARAHTHATALNLKSSEAPLILHADEEMQEELATWYKKETYQPFTFFGLTKRTIFENQIGPFNHPMPECISPAQEILTQAAPQLKDKENTFTNHIKDYLGIPKI